MLQKTIKSVVLLFRYAPRLTILKLLQVGVSAVLAPLSIFFTQKIIDTATGIITNSVNWNELALWAGLLLIAMLLSSVGGGFLNGIMYICMKRALSNGITPDLLEKFRRLDYSCFEDSAVQNTLERMTNDPQEELFQLFLSILGVMECSLGVVGAALIYAQAGWWFITGFAALLVPMIWLDFKVADKMNTMFNEQSTDERKMHYLGTLLSHKSSLFELKIFRATEYIAAKWRAIAHTVLNTRVRTILHAQKIFLVSTVLFKCWSFFIVLNLMQAVVRGSITLGIFTALIASTGTVLNNADVLSYTVQNLRRRSLLMEHYHKFMSLPEDHEGGEVLTHEHLHIVFENVVFTYPNTDFQILKGVSFDIKQGERVALVGENGAGKSTIVKLLCRLYKPDSGRILINGKDIQTLESIALRRVFSVVFQDFSKYELTLRENVAFGDLSKLCDDDALNSALKMGFADGIVALDTPLGKLEDNGVDISGGQWQRIAVARASLSNSAFAILDEPTAALDPIAESNMYHSFAEVLKNRGCILISHRLASAKMASKIIVLSDGIVSEIGGHDELMQTGGLYARMYESQSAWYAKGGVKP